MNTSIYIHNNPHEIHWLNTKYKDCHHYITLLVELLVIVWVMAEQYCPKKDFHELGAKKKKPPLNVTIIHQVIQEPKFYGRHDTSFP
jgi:hypothetical protein